MGATQSHLAPMEFLTNHQEAVVVLLAYILGLVQARIAQTGKIKTAFAILGALEDGIQKDEIRTAIAAYRATKAVKAGQKLEAEVAEH